MNSPIPAICDKLSFPDPPPLLSASIPLHTYLVNDPSISSVSNIPFALTSSPTSIFPPPLVQLSPAASSLVIIIELY